MDELAVCAHELLHLCQETMPGSDFSDLYTGELTFVAIVGRVKFISVEQWKCVRVCVFSQTDLLVCVIKGTLRSRCERNKTQKCTRIPGPVKAHRALIHL